MESFKMCYLNAVALSILAILLACTSQLKTTDIDEILNRVFQDSLPPSMQIEKSYISRPSGMVGPSIAPVIAVRISMSKSDFMKMVNNESIKALNVSHANAPDVLHLAIRDIGHRSTLLDQDMGTSDLWNMNEFYSVRTDLAFDAERYPDYHNVPESVESIIIAHSDDPETVRLYVWVDWMIAVFGVK
jgi:hypothetical protein